MTTLTGANTRTIVGYVITLLDYPRWFIEREVDFTTCHLSGGFDANDAQCSSCRFGDACRWLNANSAAPSNDASLGDLLRALATATRFLHSSRTAEPQHVADCGCETCDWLRDAQAFLRRYRHKT